MIDLMSDEELMNLKTGSVMFFDVECYWNFFYILFKSADNGKHVAFEMSKLSKINYEKLSWMLWRFCIVGFNSKNYDIPILSLCFKGTDSEDLKTATNYIIQSDLTPFHFEKFYKLKIQNYNHIDLVEVLFGKGSLKLYGGRLHSPTIQDLPIHEDEVLTTEQMDVIRPYCANDLDVTELLFNHSARQINLRIDMSKKYGVDLRSKSDAQIAEAVLNSELEKMTGVRPRRPTFQNPKPLKYDVPDFIEFQTPVLKKALETVRNLEFELSEGGSPIEPVDLKKLTVLVGNSVYNLGMGGLHSKENCVSYKADENTIIADNDVASYYPNIILNQGLYPPHLGEKFLDVYKNIVETRIDAKGKAKQFKKAGDKEQAKHYQTIADSLKITINGSFGKLGNKWSTLYAPQLMLQVTITGQLSLLMLIESLEQAGISVVSGNTDGIVSVYHKDRHDEVRQIIKNWEEKTNFETEETRYSALYSRDVNSYVAIKMNGDESSKFVDEKLGCKTKGGFTGCQAGLSKNPVTTICLEAVLKYLKNRTPVERTIRECDDIRKFVTVRNVKGGAHKEHSEMANGVLTKKMVYLGKVVRFYYAKGEPGTINYVKNDNKVPLTDGAKPLMKLPPALLTDIDYSRYVEIAIDLLYDCEGLKRDKQMFLF